MNEPVGSTSPEDSRVDPKQQFVPGAGKLGMILFLASLTMLFVASIMGFVVIRLRAEEWPPAGSPSLPQSLWLSTIIIILCSVFIHWAMRAAKQGNLQSLKNNLLLTLAAGIGFLIVQSVNWFSLTLADFAMTKNLYAFNFYFLTGLHAAHVIGGIIVLAFVTRSAFVGKYSAEQHNGVEYAAMYWHFLDAVWIVLFIAILILG